MPPRTSVSRKTTTTELTRYVAFLRGINVGGHRVAMADLRAHFTNLGFANVETFIASGNVIFSADAAAVPVELERHIEAHLAATLGYAVPTFLRTPADVATLAARRPFSDVDMNTPEFTVHVGMLRDVPPKSLAAELRARQTAVDEFALHGRELYWLIRGRTMESLVTWQKLEKLLKIDITMRNVTSVRKLAATLAAPPKASAK